MKYHLHLLLSFLLLSLHLSSLRAAGPEHDHPLSVHHDETLKFVANLGQWEPHILYMAQVPGGKVFIEQDRLTFHLADTRNLHDDYFHGQGERRDRKFVVPTHAFQIVFPGCNPHPEIVPEGKYSEYHNYFLGNDASKWKGNVPLYAQLTLKEIWPGTDLVLYGKEKTLKYEFRVNDANIAHVRMQYRGLDALQQRPDGGMDLVTSVGTVHDGAPITYLDEAPARHIDSRIQMHGNEVSFELGQLPSGHFQGEKTAWRPEFLGARTGPIVIDPSLVFGSYTGSTADNFGYTATYDTAGNLYGGGIAFALGYPTTLGALQTTFAGGFGAQFGTGFDISISKFNATGTALIWSSYLGGSGDEQPHSLITNTAGELMVYGRTSSLNFPTTTGAFQTINKGMDDIIVTHFNAAGSALVGSTYVGGAGTDGLNVHTSPFSQLSLYQNYGDDARGEIMIDPVGNIYVASCTQSNNFPTTAGVLQAAQGGGTQDAVVFKLDPTCTTLGWSTYLGGNGNDAAYSVKLNAAGEVFVAGGTESNNFPTTAGVIHTTFQGVTDGFITRLNPNATAIIASTFIGTAAYDQCYFLELDQNGDVFVVGQTRGAFPVTPGTFNNPNSGQFVAKYGPALNTTLFSTVFGTGGLAPNISPTAFLVDRCGFIYVSGWGGTVNSSGNTNGMPVSANAFQSTTDGSDMYLIVLQPDALGLEYATFYGGATSAEHVDGGTSRFDKRLVVYQAVCAGCGSNSDFPTTPGVVSQTNNSFNCNLGVFKFAFDPQDVFASYTSIALDSCAPFPVNFTNNSQGGLQYVWNFGDGSPNVTTFNASHIFQNAGTYTVTLVAIDSNSCNFSDTAVAIVTVYANPFILVSQSDTNCAGNDVQLQASGGQFYDWSPGIFLSDSTISNPIATPAVNTLYTVIVSDTNGCVDTASVNLAVTFFQADAGPPTAFCEGSGGAQLQAGAITDGVAPYYYVWWCDSSNTYCGLDSMFDDNPVGNPTSTTWYYLQVQDSEGCLSEVDSALVEVLPLPIADAGPDQYICQAPSPGALLQGSISGAPGPYVLHWISSVGLNDSTLLNPFARPDTTTIYTLVATAGNGCSSNPTTVDTLSTVTVHVQPRPIADAGPDIHTCLGDTVIIPGLGYGAGPVYEFEWSPATGLSDSAITNPMASPPFTHIYSLTVWSNGCPSYGDSMTFWVHTLPTPSPGNIVEICLGDSGQLDAFGAGDSSATYTYLWQPSDGLSDPLAENPLASPDSSVWYTLEVTSSWGCRSPLDSVLLRVKPTPIAEAGPNLQICAGDTLTLPGGYYYASTDSAPTSEIYYAWTPAASISDTTLAQPQAWPSGNTFYYLDVYYNTCRTTDSLLVSLIPGLGAWAMADTTVICAGDSVLLSAFGGNGGASITWSPANVVAHPDSFSTMAAPNDTTAIIAAVTQGGCTEVITFDIAAIARPQASFLPSTLLGCPSHPMQFLSTSDGALAYIWNFGDGSPVSNFPNPEHAFQNPGDYQVSLIALGQGACPDTASIVTVHVGDNSIIEFSTDPEYPTTLSLPDAVVRFFNESMHAADFVWDFGDGIQSDVYNPIHTYTQPGTYYVELHGRSVEDCPGSVVHGPFVVVAQDLFIPNVFSPNGDGLNDRFLPEYTGDQPYLFEVYDRWGARKFSTVSKYASWDGMDAKGNAMPDGVFYYLVRVGDKPYTGEITLIR